MALTIRRADYYYTGTRDRPGAALDLLSRLAEVGVSLLAFNAIPVGPERAQITIFPEDPGRLVGYAQSAGLVLDGPYPAIVVQGDDRLGALAAIHSRLADSRVNVFESQGVTDGRGGFGYLIHVRAEDVERGVQALQTLGD